ncbi:MAG: nanT 1 [Verrucomicrobiales bacterium]|nr:nanT 1 [Verrucomicrobiales bacterium]
MTRTQWLICIIASIGFAFDIYELLMLPLIIKPALLSLGGFVPGSEDFSKWGRILFFVPAIFGGVFGLLGGWMTDRLGRRRVLTWSILIYAFGAFAAGFSTNVYQLLVCRCFVFVGVCVEFVAAVAWLAEIFPDPKKREKVLGFTQAFSSFGGLLVAVVYGFCVRNAASLPSIHGVHEAWRYTLISGLIPAIPLIIIRPFLPESPSWLAKKTAGTLRRPSIKELFQPALIRTTLVTTALFACCYGIAFGAIQHLPQMVPGLADVKTAVAAAQAAVPKPSAAAGATASTPGAPAAAPAPATDANSTAAAAPAGVVPPAPTPAASDAPAVAAAATTPAAATGAAAGKPAGPPSPLAKALAIAKSETEQKASASVQTWQEVGGLVGRVILAFAALYIVSRRSLLRLFLVPCLIFIPGLFWWMSNNFATPEVLGLFKWAVFAAGVLLVAQFSFWGNYIPRVFPLHLRGTGESFAANIGGRVLGTSMAWVFFTASASSPPNPGKMAVTAAVIALVMGVLGLILTFFLPEPGPEEEGH